MFIKVGSNTGQVGYIVGAYCHVHVSHVAMSLCEHDMSS